MKTNRLFPVKSGIGLFVFLAVVFLIFVNPESVNATGSFVSFSSNPSPACGAAGSTISLTSVGRSAANSTLSYSICFSADTTAGNAGDVWVIGTTCSNGNVTLGSEGGTVVDLTKTDTVTIPSRTFNYILLRLNENNGNNCTIGGQLAFTTVCGGPSSTVSPTITPTITQTVTRTMTQTMTQTIFQTITQTPTITNSPSSTFTLTPTRVYISNIAKADGGDTNSVLIEVLPYCGSPTNSPTMSPTWTLSSTLTATLSPTITITNSQSPTYTNTAVPSNTISPTLTMTPTFTATVFCAIRNITGNASGGMPYTDCNGNVWSADQAYSAGSWGYTVDRK